MIDGGKVVSRFLRKELCVLSYVVFGVLAIFSRRPLTYLSLVLTRSNNALNDLAIVKYGEQDVLTLYTVSYGRKITSSNPQVQVTYDKLSISFGKGVGTASEVVLHVPRRCCDVALGGGRSRRVCFPFYFRFLLFLAGVR